MLQDAGAADVLLHVRMLTYGDICCRMRTLRMCSYTYLDAFAVHRSLIAYVSIRQHMAAYVSYTSLDAFALHRSLLQPYYSLTTALLQPYYSLNSSTPFPHLTNAHVF